MHDIETCHSLAELRELRRANPVAALVAITPQLANQLLQIERKNREIYPLVVEKYCEEMRAGGGWTYNAETVKLASNFAVLDAQHRLLAVIATGIPLVALIAFDVPPEAIHTIDIGRLRSGGDILSIEGCKSGRRVSATIAKCWMYDRNMSAMARPSKNQIYQFWRKHPEVEASAAMVRHARRWNESLAAWLHFVTAGDAMAFIEQVDSGSALEKNDPRFQLFEVLIEAKQRPTKASRVDVRFVWGVTCKAYRLSAEDRRLKELRWPVGEKFPYLPAVLAPNAGKTLEISAPAKAA